MTVDFTSEQKRYLEGGLAGIAERHGGGYCHVPEEAA